MLPPADTDPAIASPLLSPEEVQRQLRLHSIARYSYCVVLWVGVTTLSLAAWVSLGLVSFLSVVADTDPGVRVVHSQKLVRHSLFSTQIQAVLPSRHCGWIYIHNEFIATDTCRAVFEIPQGFRAHNYRHLGAASFASDERLLVPVEEPSYSHPLLFVVSVPELRLVNVVRMRDNRHAPCAASVNGSSVLVPEFDSDSMKQYSILGGRGSAGAQEYRLPEPLRGIQGCSVVAGRDLVVATNYHGAGRPNIVVVDLRSDTVATSLALSPLLPFSEIEGGYAESDPDRGGCLRITTSHIAMGWFTVLHTISVCGLA